MCRQFRPLIGESGAGAILGIVILISCFAFFSLGSLFGRQVVDLARLEAISETMALAAADALRGVTTGYPCIVAKDIATINKVHLDRCRIVGFEVFVETSLDGTDFSISSRARAGP